MQYAGTSRLLARYDALSAPWPNRLYDPTFPVQNGNAVGFAGRLLVMLAGLSLPVLYATGILAWARRQRVTKAKLLLADASVLLCA